jgi:two-component system sensor histidine kinase DegS
VILIATLIPVFFFLWYRPLVREVAERRNVESEVRRLSQKVIDSNEEESRRLARDLHDDIGQKLVALHLQLDLHRQRLDGRDTELAEQCRLMLGVIKTLSDDLRAVISGLRPPLLDDLGLLPALQAHLADLRRILPGLQVQLYATGLNRRLSKELETVLFRVCQEALSNVVKHAHADLVEIWLTSCYPTFIMIIEDNGVGLKGAASTQGNHFGLLGMRERVAAVGGALSIQSILGKGTRLRLEVPLSAKE